MENKYQRGKVYKIVDVGYNQCYIGSTTETLSNRLSKHRCQYKMYKEGKKNKVNCCLLFDEYGIENCKIELVETYPCSCVEELRTREGYYIQNTKCINKRIAGRTGLQWSYDNKEHLAKYNKTHYEKNKEEQKKSFQEYRDKNKEMIKHKQSVSVCCECGATVSKGNLARHNMTIKHRQYLQTLI